ncbi:ArsR/SmtB family transcription factor [Actinocrispum wychmicini]|uniref:Helix-turn-helix protein n=1 Tax=Actinocrispum wychmicini TaxID=1213861 RepID=A0A4R2J0K4_9PSEU|nr:winged helix-turn-helix domain-containing protein [Actinocrispum wychmicini]TCO49729.1 helix-turn-helix protein [Actinocrispum wychmicini]
MALRVHFSGADLARTTFAEAPDPAWEVLLSLHALQDGRDDRVTRWWRGQFTLDAGVRALLAIAPPVGYSPDFLTPDEGAMGPEAAFDTVAHTPRARVRAELGRLFGDRPVPEWARTLADGGRALHGLARSLQTYYRTALEPFWPRMAQQVHTDRVERAWAAVNNGLGFALSTLHPGVRWQPPVLEVLGDHVSGDLKLAGRGLRLVPSFFCHLAPTMLADPDLPPVLVYPIGRTAPAEQAGGELGALLGTTRARILRAIARGCTTTELSEHAGISAASASYHASILRDAGLVRTRRAKNAVIHTLTPLGRSLLSG